MVRSLTKRIIALSIGWIAIALLGTGVLLWWLYHAHMQDHYDARVSTHLEELVTALILPDGQPHRRGCHGCEHDGTNHATAAPDGGAAGKEHLDGRRGSY